MKIVDPAMRREARPKKERRWDARSNQSAVGRWFWETDRMLLLMVAILITIGSAGSLCFKESSQAMPTT